MQWQPVEVSATKLSNSPPQISEYNPAPSLPALVSEQTSSASRFFLVFLQFVLNENLKSGGTTLKTGAWSAGNIVPIENHSVHRRGAQLSRYNRILGIETDLAGAPYCT